MSLDNLPGVTQVAMQSGRHAAQTIIGRLAGDTTRRPFRYRDARRLCLPDHGPQAVENFRHAGYPQQLQVLLGIAKLAGAIVLLLPRLPTLKEWDYAPAISTP